MHHHILLTLACNPDPSEACAVQRRLSFGSDNVRTPGRINMSRPSSTSDSSRLSGGTRQRDCQLGQLHTAYFGLCKKVYPLATLHHCRSRCSALAQHRVLQPAADMTQSSGKTWIGQCTQRHLPTGGFTFSSCALLSECAATET